MAKQEKLVPLVHLPHGEIGAFFSPNCLYNLNAINPESPKHDNTPTDSVPWPGMPLSFTANVKAGANRMS
ncbi:hypothetical protein [Burkholderia phage FLC9]|nr:hypothetical protein [Burkholderia phage FLC9]